jgi:hypothetical protein
MSLAPFFAGEGRGIFQGSRHRKRGRSTATGKSGSGQCRLTGSNSYDLPATTLCATRISSLNRVKTYRAALSVQISYFISAITERIFSVRSDSPLDFSITVSAPANLVRNLPTASSYIVNRMNFAAGRLFLRMPITSTPLIRASLIDDQQVRF